jgi:ADP-ribose pyrophosphatase
VWSVVSDDVDFGHSIATRDIQLHPGAVAVIALDERDGVLLIRQYRHPVGMFLFEPPAGLLDEPDEPPHRTAARELAEESGYSADRWDVLVDFFNSPGGSSEAIRVFLARGLHELPEGRPHTGEAEEAHLPRAWVDLDEARDLVLAGRIGSPSGVLGILAAWIGRTSGWSTLRPPDAAWPARDALLGNDRVRLPRRHGD